MALLGTLVILAWMFMYEYERIRRYDGGRRETIAFVVASALATVFAVCVLVNAPLPNPTKILDAIFGPFGDWLHPPAAVRLPLGPKG